MRCLRFDVVLCVVCGVWSVRIERVVCVVW